MKNVFTIARREFAEFFNSPVAYAVLGSTFLVKGAKFAFVPSLFLGSSASMRGYFELVPFLFLFVVPAVTMRLIAEERKTGTIEVLMSQPVRDWEIVVGKWLAAVATLIVPVLATLIIPIVLSLLTAEGATFDWGPVIGGYLGVILCAAALSAIGVWTSALSESQIVGFILAFLVSLFLVLLGMVAYVVPSSAAEPVEYLSPVYHLNNLGRGVVDWRDVLYFLTLSGLGLLLAIDRLSTLRAPPLAQRATARVTRVLVAGAAILVNVIAVGFPLRADLTRDGAFTLSEATSETLDKIEAPVTITAYFTKDLPPPFSDQARYVADLLREYRVASSGQVSFEFIDPQSEETAEDKDIKKDLKRDIFGRTVRDKTSVETELEGYGIQPVEIRVLEEDQQQTKRAYMGIRVRHGEDAEVIPVVQGTESLEYDLTTMIRRLTREKTPVLGVVQGHGEASPEQGLKRLATLLEQNYTVRPVTLTENGETKVPDDVDALLIAGPSQPYSEDDKRAIDAFLMKGKAAAFFLDAASVDYQTFQATPVDAGLGDLVAGYGIELANQLVADVECASLNVQEKRGFMVIQMPVKYPFIPALKTLVGDSPLTKGITDVTVPFAMPLYPQKIDGVEISSLARSSQKSWLEDITPENLNPRRDWAAAEVTFTGPYTLIAQARGALPSKFEAGKTSASEARVVVAGSGGMLNDQVMGGPNAALAMNVVDWLLLDSKMLEMRNRGLSEAPFHPELSEATKTVAKLLVAAGPALLLGLYGALRLLRRQARRRSLQRPAQQTDGAPSAGGAA